MGKTTVGQALARELNWRFVDGDDYHSAQNIAKMRAGVPLDDADRAPWLQALHNAITDWLAQNENVVLACSALKSAYRKCLVVSPQVHVVYLRGNFDLIANRLADRHQHYMNPTLLQSQFDALEEPADVVTVEVNRPLNEIVDQIRSSLGV